MIFKEDWEAYHKIYLIHCSAWINEHHFCNLSRIFSGSVWGELWWEEKTVGRNLTKKFKQRSSLFAHVGIRTCMRSNQWGVSLSWNPKSVEEVFFLYYVHHKQYTVSKNCTPSFSDSNAGTAIELNQTQAGSIRLAAHC